MTRRRLYAPGVFALSATKNLLVALIIALFFTAATHAQGCSTCLNATQSTPPPVQAAYRHAIYLLGGTGASLFIAGTLLFRRNR